MFDISPNLVIIIAAASNKHMGIFLKNAYHRTLGGAGGFASNYGMEFYLPVLNSNLSNNSLEWYTLYSQVSINALNGNVTVQNLTSVLDLSAQQLNSKVGGNYFYICL